VDADVIAALYRASQAGVAITLLVRGICCLKPGVPHVSETIEVRALVDRFLEHQRVFSFANAGKEEVYISSADWMPRNFHRRVEMLIPIEDPALKARLVDTLALNMGDCVKAWVLQSDGSYQRATPKPGAVPLRSQQRFMESARDRVREAELVGRTSTRFYLRSAERQTERAMEAKVVAAEKGRRREPKKGTP
jgi:polyphosphate kinase